MLRREGGMHEGLMRGTKHGGCYVGSKVEGLEEWRITEINEELGIWNSKVRKRCKLNYRKTVKRTLT